MCRCQEKIEHSESKFDRMCRERPQVKRFLSQHCRPLLGGLVCVWFVLLQLNMVMRSFISVDISLIWLRESQSAFNQICSILRFFLIKYDRRGCSEVLWGFLPHRGGFLGGARGHCDVVSVWSCVCVHKLAVFPKETRHMHVLSVCKSEEVISKAWLPTGHGGKLAQGP